MRFWRAVAVPVMASKQATEQHQRPEDGVVFITVLCAFLQPPR
jgi:hypothetical protein